MEVRSFFPKPPYVISLHFERLGLGEKPVPAIYVDGVYRRLILLEKGWVAIKVSIVSEGLDPRLDIYVSAGPDELVGEGFKLAQHIFSTDLNYSEFISQARFLPCIYRVASKYLGLRPTRSVSLYEALVLSIAEQNISLRVALTILSRMIREIGEKVHVNGEAYYDLPAPEKLARTDPKLLRGYGFSRAKIRAMKEVAKRVDELPSIREVDNKPEEVVERLMDIWGVGRWTAELAVARSSKFFWVGPAGDLAVMRGYSKTCGEHSGEEEIRRKLSLLGCHRGLAMYLLALEYHKRNHK